VQIGLQQGIGIAAAAQRPQRRRQSLNALGARVLLFRCPEPPLLRRRGMQPTQPLPLRDVPFAAL
jgi:hypothetical protein